MPVDAATAAVDKPLRLGSRELHSRLIVGTGKYASLDLMKECLEASGAEMITVALRRVDLSGKTPNLLDHIDLSRYVLLPNTAGCYTREDAVRTAHLARELGIGEFIKLEVIGDDTTLLPDMVQTLAAAEQLAGEGFQVLAYCTDDPVLCKRLEQTGCAAVMPLGAPIGSGLGILNRNSIRLILEQAQVPILVDAGVGTASDVAVAMELGCDGVLLNTAIAGAENPLAMAHAMRMACEAGRLAHLAGRIPKRRHARASSPILDF
ncbi:MAG: thiazole synthase [Candidatus Sumerlaeia bacterium]|nr:thiazole synthase [Candidatus Sumerlaeia bacterium]